MKNLSKIIVATTAFLFAIYTNCYADLIPIYEEEMEESVLNSKLLIGAGIILLVALAIKFLSYFNKRNKKDEDKD